MFSCSDCESKAWTCLGCNDTFDIKGISARKARALIAFICSCCKHQFVCITCYKKDSQRNWRALFGGDHSVKNFMLSLRTVFVSPNTIGKNVEDEYDIVEPLELVSFYMLQSFHYSLVHEYGYDCDNVHDGSQTILPLDEMNEKTLRKLITSLREDMEMRNLSLSCQASTAATTSSNEAISSPAQVPNVEEMERTIAWGILMYTTKGRYEFLHTVSDAPIDVLIPKLMKVTELTKAKLLEAFQRDDDSHNSHASSS